MLRLALPCFSRFIYKYYPFAAVKNLSFLLSPFYFSVSLLLGRSSNSRMCIYTLNFVYIIFPTSKMTVLTEMLNGKRKVRIFASSLFSSSSDFLSLQCSLKFSKSANKFVLCAQWSAFFHNNVCFPFSNTNWHKRHFIFHVNVEKKRQNVACADLRC